MKCSLHIYSFFNTFLTIYLKNAKNSDSQKIAVITLKFKQDGFTIE